ncbi:hypothetical protein [Aquimarina sp. RZ0]|uniref:hypothetical protein n=1 Tax=Aquimarina sp. RZ0 TaxID=2607730 RepID=UPI0011F25123|nr:hypothetical protein [Aquimarina sp. RZ0]KAA1247622.1 hypothetical protein F0000_02105 [Aquimarina sp. RZ0]
MLKKYSILVVIMLFLFSFQSCSESETSEDINEIENPVTDGEVTNPNAKKDKIEEVLTTSKPAYIDAANGEWVLITATEYNALASEIENVFKSGILESEYKESSNIITTTSSPTTLSNETEEAVLPKNSYLFAFKYYAIQANDQPGLKLKLSSDGNTEGYTDIGDPLPKHTGVNEEIFFLLKGNDLSTNSKCHMAIFKPAGLTIGRKSSIDDNTYFYELGDTTNLTGKTSTPLKLLYQGLSTTTKQW